MQSGSSGFPIENVEVTAVEKQATSSFSAGLPQDAGFNHAIHRRRRGWKPQLRLAGCVADREKRVGLGISIDQERRSCTTAEALDFFLVRIEESVDVAGRPRRLICGVADTLQEEVEPRPPTFAFSVSLSRS
jgi:hypothetical protein